MRGFIRILELGGNWGQTYCMEAFPNLRVSHTRAVSLAQRSIIDGFDAQTRRDVKAP